MIDESDGFRTLPAILRPDPRQGLFARLDAEQGRYRKLTLEDHHALISDLALVDSVPESVAIHFETARNLLLYSWFVYRFIPVAEQHGYASVEFGIRARVNAAGEEAPSGLRKLLRLAVERGWLYDTGFRHWRCLKARFAELHGPRGGEFWPPEPDSSECSEQFVKILAGTIPRLRNQYAHGSAALMPGGYLAIGIACDALNQLFGGN